LEKRKVPRPTKTGLDYFPLDWDMDEDDKICLIVAECGEIAFGRLIKLTAKIYHDGGYYKKWDEETEMLFASKKNIPLDELKKIIVCALKRDFFNEQLFKQYGILTSLGIQKRYMEVAKKRKEMYMVKEYCLLTPENGISDKINWINIAEIKIDDTESTQIKVNKIKVNKSKENILPNRHIYHLIQNAFLSKNQEDYDFKKEGPHVIDLEKRALSRPNPEEFIKKVIVVFWQLTHGKDKFFNKHPFLPSKLNSKGIWPYVTKRLEQMEGQVIDAETRRFLEELF
jgi:hypothetical protein